MTESTIRLHHVPFSRSFRVLWMLTEMGMDPEIVLHSIADGSMRTPEYLQKSPAGRAPALEIDGHVLFESGAILEYLAETRPEAGFGRAPGHAERADYLQWMSFAETQAQSIGALNMQHIFLRDPSTRSKVVLKLEAKRLENTVQVIENAVTARDWLLSGGFSAADIMLGFNLFSVPYYVDLSPYPAVRSYMARMVAREGYQKARVKDGKQEFYTKDFYHWDD